MYTQPPHNTEELKERIHRKMKAVEGDVQMTLHNGHFAFVKSGWDSTLMLSSCLNVVLKAMIM
jgi:hypothetical protein